MAKTNQVSSEEEIYKVEEPNISVPSTKKPKEILFKSIHYGTIVFLTQDKYIKFINGSYRTSDPAEIDALRKHPAFNQEIFENEYPSDVLDKRRKDKEYLRTFDIGEEEVEGLL